MIITASTKELKNIPDNYRIISVVLYPRFLKTENIKDLAPSRQIFNDDKEGKYPSAAAYKKDYFDHIKKFNFEKLFSESKDICFVCFCPPRSETCHRRYLGQYIEKNYGIKVKELSDL